MPRENFGVSQTNAEEDLETQGEGRRKAHMSETLKCLAEPHSIPSRVSNPPHMEDVATPMPPFPSPFLLSPPFPPLSPEPMPDP